MNSLKRAAITSVGHYVPPDVYDNHYFESFLDTSDQWIRERTGIIERRFLKEGATSDLAVPAIQQCLERRGMSPEEIECIIVATVTPDMFFPSTACVIQDKLGAKNAWGFDLSGACSAYLFALSTGARLIESGAHKNVIVVGADKMSSIMNFKDRNTAILFGDGGGAALLEPDVAVQHDHVRRLRGGSVRRRSAGRRPAPAQPDRLAPLRFRLVQRARGRRRPGVGTARGG
jgi:3-oxoacyl-[acyl-carrier-protein] synthase-3